MALDALRGYFESTVNGRQGTTAVPKTIEGAFEASITPIRSPTPPFHPLTLSPSHLLIPTLRAYAEGEAHIGE